MALSKAQQAHADAYLEKFMAGLRRRNEGQPEFHQAVHEVARDIVPFLEDKKCGVYEARPQQCRTFPFWEENVRSRHNWQRLREFCPGIDEGPVHTLIQIQDQVRDASES